MREKLFMARASGAKSINMMMTQESRRANVAQNMSHISHLLKNALANFFLRHKRRRKMDVHGRLAARSKRKAKIKHGEFLFAPYYVFLF
jgi:hypothetical protein